MNTVNKFYFPQLFYHTSPVYPHNTSCEVSTPRFHKNCVCVYIYIYSLNLVLKLVMAFQAETCS